MQQPRRMEQSGGDKRRNHALARRTGLLFPMDQAPAVPQDAGSGDMCVHFRGQVGGRARTGKQHADRLIGSSRADLELRAELPCSRVGVLKAVPDTNAFTPAQRAG